MPTIEYQTPNMIDGDPQEVRAAVVRQLVALSTTVEQITRDSQIMLRNSHMSRVLRAAPSTTAVELEEEWEESDERGRCARLIGSAVTLSAVANQLAKGTTDG